MSARENIVVGRQIHYASPHVPAPMLQRGLVLEVDEYMEGARIQIDGSERQEWIGFEQARSAPPERAGGGC